MQLEWTDSPEEFAERGAAHAAAVIDDMPEAAIECGRGTTYVPLTLLAGAARPNAGLREVLLRLDYLQTRSDRKRDSLLPGLGRLCPDRAAGRAGAHLVGPSGLSTLPNQHAPA